MMPALFLAHGLPTLMVDDARSQELLGRIAADLPRPAAIIVVSGRWDTVLPTVNAVGDNDTIQDCAGLRWRAFAYPAPGSAALAERVTDLLAAQGLACRIDDARGLDHGAWVPLMLMYPAHDIPVIQLSLQSRLGPGHHFQLGKALAPLRLDDILIVGSGSAPDMAASEFARWLDTAVIEGRICDLMSWRTRAPQAGEVSELEQLLPLFVALGAAIAGPGECARPSVRRLHSTTIPETIRMDAYAFT